MVIDISRELFSAPVYPGDPVPEREVLRRLELGDPYALSAFSSGCHCGTHMDAPSHYILGGEPIDQTNLDCCYGPCTVIEARGIVTGADIDRIVDRSEKRLLLRGEGQAWLSPSAAFALADAGFCLVGTDAVSIAPTDNETDTHTELLNAGIAILEGLDLSLAEPGDYILTALPLKLGGCEAAPVRAALMRDE